MNGRRDYDVMIVGGGVVGSAIARELSRYRLRVALVEKESDVAEGISKANSGVLHAGFNVPPGSLKARFNAEGLAYFPDLADELDVPSRRSTKLVVAKNRQELEVIERLLEQGRRNGTEGLSIVGRERIEKIAPGVQGEWALYSERTGIINPFLFTIALAENAALNGVDVYLQTEITAIRKLGSAGGDAVSRTGGAQHGDTQAGGAQHGDTRPGGPQPGSPLDDAGGFELKTADGRSFGARLVINSAGLGSDRVARMIDPSFPEKIYPCRGEYHIVDKEYGKLLDVAVYPVPVKDGRGLGVHLTPTTNGNILFGPSAEYIDAPDDTATTTETMRMLLDEAYELFPPLRGGGVIRSYAGIRPKLFTPESGVKFKDFHIAESSAAPGFLNLVGIESPGLTAAPALASYVVGDFVSSHLKLVEKDDFQPSRHGIPRTAHLSPAQIEALSRQDAEFAEIYCRCEGVSKAEIRRAIENPLGVRTLNGIKKRSYSMMGRCQSGFCLPRIVRMLTDEYDLPPERVSISGPGTEILSGRLS